MTNLTIPTQTMSSLEIAELTGKRHDHVLRDIKKTLIVLYGSTEVASGLPDKDAFEAFCSKLGWGIDSPKLGNERIQGVRVIRDSRGFISEIGLDYTHSMTVVSGYNVKVRKVIIDRWQELEQVTQTLAVQQGMTQKELIQQAKLDAQLAEVRLRLQRALDNTEMQKLNHANKLQQIKDRHTRIMSQGSKLKADGSISKLALPVDTITNLLKLHGSMLKPSDANNMLKRLGYLSDDGSEVTDAGSFYGRTIKSSESSNTTLPRWFKEEFGVLLSAIMQEWDIVNE